MIISISGAQGTGKTSIIEMLKDCGYEVETPSASRVISAKMYPAGKDGEVAKEWDIAKLMRKHLRPCEGIKFLDRSVVDALSYMKCDGSYDDPDFKGVREFLEACIPSLDAVVTLPVGEFALEHDGVRPDSADFQAKWGKALHEIVTKYGLTTIEVHGTVEERCEQIAKWLDQTGLFAKANL